MGRALKALKAGDQVWAPLGQEGAHSSLDGLEMKGACPPPRPPTTKQDVLEGTRALDCQPVPCACLCHLICSTTLLPALPQSLRLRRVGSVSKEKVVLTVQGARGYAVPSGLYLPRLPLHQEPLCRGPKLHLISARNGSKHVTY